MIVYYSSKSGNTRRFCAKLSSPSVSIDEYTGGKYILITPTFADADGRHAVPKPVIQFLNMHRHNMVGVVGCGNRNFGSMFCIGAAAISLKCNVPVLHRIELSGTDEDIEIVDGIHERELPAMQGR